MGPSNDMLPRASLWLSPALHGGKDNVSKSNVGLHAACMAGGWCKLMSYNYRLLLQLMLHACITPLCHARLPSIFRQIFNPPLHSLTLYPTVADGAKAHHCSLLAPEEQQFPKHLDAFVAYGEEKHGRDRPHQF